MAETHKLTIMETSRISPPPNTVPKTPLHLSFLDVPWFLCPPNKRVLFYDFPHPPQIFLQETLPKLKHSLSLTLQHFFPFTSQLFFPPPPQEPYFLHSDGDSVPFTVAESAADFNHLVGNHTRDVNLFHPLVPELPPKRVLPDGTRVFAAMAIQVTVFPSTGICIGLVFNHVAGDGVAFNHFLKSWAFVCKSKGDDLSFIEKFPPFHSRDKIQDLKGLKPVLLKQVWDSWQQAPEKDKEPPKTDVTFNNNVRATFIMDRVVIERLKKRVSTRMILNGSEPFHVSSFVATCAWIWVCMVKTQKSKDKDREMMKKVTYFAFVADIRTRLGFTIPSFYFGNCLDFCVESVKTSELVGENGLVVAAKAIGKEVEELQKGGALRRGEKWVHLWKKIGTEAVSVAGSPKLRVYETDFGWGRPKKSEVVHIDTMGAIALNECRDEEGGIEVALVFDRDEMKVFKSIYEQELNQLMTTQ